ncbi:MAG: T9SS type A sorting domain-containing protein, partial [Bacteroidales bacterium]|nr:T9SS type A sorting domain-containing protein [Bacteroidales bacterium]
LTLLIVLALIIQATGSSQPCLPEGITFTTQAQIDNFQTNYPGCTEIEGDVTISGFDITNLTGLNVLTSIWGYLKIYDNDALTNLTGLENITSIEGNLSIGYYNSGGNPSMTSLTGLDNVTSIGGRLSISGNSALTSLTGLDNVTSIGGYLGIYYNDALTSLTGLDNVTSIGGGLYISGNNALTSLTALDNVTSIGGSLWIEYNDSLTSLTGLDNVSSIGGNLWIYYNAALISLTGLDNVTSIGESIFFGHNDAMINLTGLENLTFIGGHLTIWANNALTSLSGLDNVTSIGGELHIESNDVLTSLTGLNNLDAASIVNLFITDNYSLSNCEVQSICNYLANPNGTVNIYGNATGCNNPPEVANACGIILPCLPYGNYYFHTQTEIDDFQTNYPGCTELEGFVKISGGNITNLIELNVITTIGRSLYIWHNDSLTSLTDLDNVTSIGGDLWILNNDILTSLSGLDNIDAGSISNLYISHNSSLSTCEVQSVCDYLVSPSVYLIIFDNTTGCNNKEEVEKACESIGIPNINVESEFSIYPNPAKKEICISVKNGTIINEVNIYNQIGQKVLQKKRITSSIDVSKLRQGMYIIELV